MAFNIFDTYYLAGMVQEIVPAQTFFRDRYLFSDRFGASHRVRGSANKSSYLGLDDHIVSPYCRSRGC